MNTFDHILDALSQRTQRVWTQPKGQNGISA